jgi:formylglycine-generating enzyme required for sulfatase activity
VGGPNQPTPVGMYPEGATPQGVLDLAGNVYEWTADWFGAYAEAAATNPKGPENGTAKSIRGGAWYNNPWDLRVSYRYLNHADGLSSVVGFRCVRELLSL